MFVKSSLCGARGRYLRCPAYISIGDPGAGKKDIEQRVVWTSEGSKRKQLKEVL